MQNSVFMDVFIRTTYSSLTVNVTVTNLSPASVQLTYAFLFITHQSTIYSVRSSTGLGDFNFLSFLIRVSYHVFSSFFLFFLSSRPTESCVTVTTGVAKVLSPCLSWFFSTYLLLLARFAQLIPKQTHVFLPAVSDLQFATSEHVDFENYSVVFNSQVSYSSDIVNFNNKRRWAFGLEQSAS